MNTDEDMGCREFVRENAGCLFGIGLWLFMIILPMVAYGPVTFWGAVAWIAVVTFLMFVMTGLANL